MFNFGPEKILLIMVVVLLLFGAKRLPEIGSSLGRGIREFKRSINDLQNDVHLPNDSRTSDWGSDQREARPAPSPAEPLDVPHRDDGDSGPKRLLT